MCVWAQVIRLFNQFSLSPADLAAQPAADDAIEPVGELTADQLLRFLNEVQVRPRRLPPSREICSASICIRGPALRCSAPLPGSAAVLFVSVSVRRLCLRSCPSAVRARLCFCTRGEVRWRACAA